MLKNLKLKSRIIIILGKLLCRLGGHDLSSYSETLKDDGVAFMSRLREFESQGFHGADAFFEMSALRCSRCSYVYRGRWNGKRI